MARRGDRRGLARSDAPAHRVRRRGVPGRRRQAGAGLRRVDRARRSRGSRRRAFVRSGGAPRRRGSGGRSGDPAASPGPHATPTRSSFGTRDDRRGARGVARDLDEPATLAAPRTRRPRVDPTARSRTGRGGRAAAGVPAQAASAARTLRMLGALASGVARLRRHLRRGASRRGPRRHLPRRRGRPRASRGDPRDGARGASRCATTRSDRSHRRRCCEG